MTHETMIPALPCVSISETLDFYRLLNFEVTYQQASPNPYAATRRKGGGELHFFGLKGLKPAEAFSTCLVIVEEVEGLHQTFAAALRGVYGKIPIAGVPRITRMKKGQSRFTVVDPSGNSLIFIRRDEPGGDGEARPEQGARSRLAKAIDAAARLRDYKGDDAAAAKVLDVALGRNEPAAPIERARALAARAELAVALGDQERSRALRAELQQIPLSEAERERLRDELQAAEELEKSQR
ncbi:hypothetical protein [Hyalangium sp.]|uniref:hypothetical protein n=1 Tax=Hyalangium sp. TaxID=2028555 RepID=UPI002D541289|nr:hypothetical protein [Hyalangium sp.]HYH95110.1 hypothetical protein [Hyalangium sp.]